jgi:hypothetical protein
MSALHRITVDSAVCGGPVAFGSQHPCEKRARSRGSRYLLEKGATPELADANGKKPIDLLDVPAVPVTTGRGTGARGSAAAVVTPATAAEIGALLRDPASTK